MEKNSDPRPDPRSRVLADPSVVDAAAWCDRANRAVADALGRLDDRDAAARDRAERQILDTLTPDARLAAAAFRSAVAGAARHVHLEIAAEKTAAESRYADLVAEAARVERLVDDLDAEAATARLVSAPTSVFGGRPADVLARISHLRPGEHVDVLDARRLIAPFAKAAIEAPGINLQIQIAQEPAGVALTRVDAVPRQVGTGSIDTHFNDAMRIGNKLIEDGRARARARNDSENAKRRADAAEAEVRKPRAGSVRDAGNGTVRQTLPCKCELLFVPNGASDLRRRGFDVQRLISCGQVIGDITEPRSRHSQGDHWTVREAPAPTWIAAPATVLA